MNSYENSSALEIAKEKLADYWKDDFAPLQSAGATINAALRADEHNADLYHRILEASTVTGTGAAAAAAAATATAAGSHLYFPVQVEPTATASPSWTAPPQPPPLMRLEHRRSLNLPLTVTQELATTGNYIQMGLFSEAGLAWTIVNEKLYLWSFESTVTAASAASQNAPPFVAEFATPSKEHVVTIGLVRPKQGVFRSFVEWCLIVATPSEAFLCAVVLPSAQSSNTQDDLKVIATSFFVETESRVVSIAGSESGRVFLGCLDGGVYEMSYNLDNGNNETDSATLMTMHQKLDQFYDKGELASVAWDNAEQPTLTKLLQKRVWSAVKTVATGLDERPFKRAKISQTASIATKMGRGNPLAWLGGTSPTGSKVLQMAMDDARGCLYTLSSDGTICALTCDGVASVQLVASMDTKKTARLFLDAVSRGQGFPPSHSSAHTGTIAFPGGGSSAQAGVGGMEGARAILKLHEMYTNGGSSTSSTGKIDVLKPISIHVISTTESSRLTLLAVTEGGLRLYLSSLDSQYISVGSNSVATNRHRNGNGFATRNPRAPSRRITLCHIRAPPPVSKADAKNNSLSVGLSGGVVGGVTPSNAGSLHSGLEKALYSRGVFVAAVKRAQTATNGVGSSWLEHQKSVENTIVAACPDIVARQLENNTTERCLTRLGGITESTTLPMAMAYGGDSASAGLPGGAVWSLAEVQASDSAILNLAVNSKTPTETELSIGIPQAYAPRPTLQGKSTNSQDAHHGRVVAPNFSNMNGSSAIVSVGAMATNVSIQILGKIMAGLLLPNSRVPSRTPGLSLNQNAWDMSDVQPLYRVSKRQAAKGFSRSGREVVSRASNVQLSSFKSAHDKAAAQSQVAHLRSFTLYPATVPLHHNSASIFSHSREVIALNASGLHYYGVKTVLSSLAEALEAANENVATDKMITSIFDGYGYNEGCCMCLSLAIGCVPGGNDSELLRGWARNAAWSRAFAPKLIWHGGESGSPAISRITETTDPMIPSGYEFKGSAIYEGMTALLSRLIRPIWHKPAVVLTNGPVVQQKGSIAPTKMPARVELLLDDESLNAVSNHLCNLQKLVKTLFSRAVTLVPGGQHPATSNGGILLLTSALQLNSQLKIGSVGAMSSSEAEKIAQLAEEKNIHSLYRLLHRIIQLLDLFSILGRVSHEEVDVDWGRLHGLTFAQLTQTNEGHDRLSTLLNSIVTSPLSVQANHLAAQFVHRCYCYFSPGSHYVNLGLQKTNEALSLLHTSRDRMTIVARDAALHFCEAARHWFSASLVTGRFDQTTGKETVENIVRAAIQSDSPLAIAAKALMELRDAYSLVEVCLITASNFMVGGSSSRRTSDVGAERQSEYSWEQSLYHVRHAELQRLGGSSSQNSSNTIIDYGSDRTNQNAVNLCYSLVFYHFSSLVRSGTSQDSHLADQIVSACAAEPDESFLEAFFSYLLESDNAAVLLRIEGPVVEKWLRGRKDSELMWRYFNVQNRHEESGQFSLDVAQSMKANLTLDERINWLSRSVNSLNSTGAQGSVRDLGSTTCVTLQQARDSLELARIQNKITGEIRRSYPEESREKLESALLSASELFNDITGPLGMTDESLLILKVCQKNDSRLICQLWKTVILDQLLPCVTFDKSTYSRLLSYVNDPSEQHNIKWQSADGVISSQKCMIEGQLMLISGDMKWKLIDNGEWVTSFVQRIDKLGESLISRVANPGDAYSRYVPNAVFPVDFILSQLQALRNEVFPDRSPGWSLLTLAGAGVPFLVVIDAYERITQSSNAITLAGQDSDKDIERVSAVLELMEYWMSIVISRVDGGYRAEAQMELRDVRFARYVESVKAQIGRIPATSGLLLRLHEVERNKRNLV